MKKLFTLIAVAMMAIGANAQTEPVTYTFDNQASTYVLGDYCEGTVYSMDGKEGFAVNYTGAGSDQKMHVKLAANEDIFFEYSNSKTKNNAMKTGEKYVQCDSKNFVINVPLQKDDVIQVKFSAKGDNAPTVTIYGSEPCIEAKEGTATTCSGKTEGEAEIFEATATKGGTAKIKETANGMRVYAISINNDITTGVKTVSATKSENSAIYNALGQRVDANAKGLMIQNGKKYIAK